MDAKENLERLSVEDHAEAHKWLFIENGDPRDALAWLSLLGTISLRERAAELAALGGKVGGPKLRGIPKTEEHKRRLRGPRGPYGPMPEERRIRYRKPKSAAHRENIRQARLGSKNPMFGTSGNAGSFKTGSIPWNKGKKTKS